VRLKQTIAGLIFILNSFLVEWVFPSGANVAGVSAMIGAVILGYPIVWSWSASPCSRLLPPAIIRRRE